jgi:uncharacterized protein YqgC (DUF456 family)
MNDLLPITTAPADWIYWVCLSLLLLANVVCWLVSFFMMPGNWVMVALAAVCAFFLPEQEGGLGVSWWAVLVLALLAGLGELIEFAAGAAGAAKQGASRRAMMLSLVGAIIGSVAGAIIGLPIPFVGPVVAALGGAGAGAFLGAYLGETWKGRSGEERMNVSKGALVGRLLGTVGKLMVGSVMVVYVTFESLGEPLVKLIVN